jgi:methoxymalonate biosynthesis acyl carrier protein
MTEQEDGNEWIRTAIRSYVTVHTGDVSLSDDADFFDLGVVNSLFAMELITFIEREFDLIITVEDLCLDNFRSIAACSSFVELRRCQ